MKRTLLLFLVLLLPSSSSRAAPPTVASLDGRTLDGCRNGAFSSDGRRLAALSGNPACIKVWDCETAKELLTIPGASSAGTNSRAGSFSFSRVLYSRDDQRLITSALFPEQGLAIWDANSGQLLRRFGTNLLATNTNQSSIFPRGNSQLQFFRLALSQDGQLVYAAAFDYGRFGVPGAVGCWDIASGDLRFSIQESSGTLRSLVFSPDANYMAAYLYQSAMAMGMTTRRGPPERGIAVWDARSGKRKHTLPFASQGANVGGPAMALNAEGQQLAAFASDGQAASLHLWDIENGKELSPVRLKDLTAQSCSCIVFSPDSKSIALVLDGRQVALVEAATGKVLWSVDSASAVHHVEFSPGGKLLAAGCGDPNEIFGSTGDVKLWRVATGKVVKNFRSQRGYAAEVRFSPDGQRLLSLNDVSMMLWMLPAD